MTFFEWTSGVALVIGSGGLLAWIISLFKLKAEIKAIRSKANDDDAHADSLMIDAAKGLIEPLKERIDEQDEIIKLMKEKHEKEIIEAKRTHDIALQVAEEKHKREIELFRKEIDTLTFCKDEHAEKFLVMDEKIIRLQDKNNRLINGINILINQLKLANQCPMWQPSEDDCETLVVYKKNDK